MNHHTVVLADSEEILECLEFHIYVDASNCIVGTGQPIIAGVRLFKGKPYTNLSFKFEIDTDLTWFAKCAADAIERIGPIYGVLTANCHDFCKYFLENCENDPDEAVDHSKVSTAIAVFKVVEMGTGCCVNTLNLGGSAAGKAAEVGGQLRSELHGNW